MADVEVLLAARPGPINTLRGQLRQDDPPPAAQMKRRLLRAFVGETTFREVTAPGLGRALVFSVIIDEADIDDLDELDAGPGARRLGAWKIDGLPLGVEFTFDRDGNITGTRGTPTVPTQVALLTAAMPDREGLPRPTEPFQAHQYMGWAPRRLDLG